MPAPPRLLVAFLNSPAGSEDRLVPLSLGNNRVIGTLQIGLQQEFTDQFGVGAASGFPEAGRVPSVGSLDVIRPMPPHAARSRSDPSNGTKQKCDCCRKFFIFAAVATDAIVV